MKFKPKARVSDLVIQNSGSELLIFDLKTNTALSLNETSARIWQSCNGEREAADICSYLEESDGTYVNQEIVLLAIRQLSDSNLLAAKTSDSDKSKRVSRRKLLRQIGTGSAVALPIIHSIVAPQASAAGSISAGPTPTPTPPPATPPGTACTQTGALNTQGTCAGSSQRCVGGACKECVDVPESLTTTPAPCPLLRSNPRDPRSNECCVSTAHCLSEEGRGPSAFCSFQDTLTIRPMI